MTLKLYFDLLSQPSRALYIFLKVNDIKFEANKVDLKSGEQFKKPYRAVNPLGLVPVIDDNGFKLTESVGILRYLCREKDVADHWYPKDSKLQARVDEYLEWQHINTRASCFLYFRAKVMIPLLSGTPPNKENVAKRMKTMNATLDKIENIWLKDDKPFLTGNKISIADILGACEVEQPRMAGFDPCLNRPKMTAWMERVQKELNPHYEEAHKIVRLAARYGFLFDAYCASLKLKSYLMPGGKKKDKV